ncbi:MAG: hypothetical protein EA402_06140 [Planctomycetota bacterium]|nr:MAG: hypothetical protein EA402_06140 [Planctomycetota bacterium]
MSYRIILVRTQGPINLGMIMRSCANLGLDDLHLVAPLCDPNDPDARRFANHVRDHLSSLPVHQTLDEALCDCDLAIATSARDRDPEAAPSLDLAAIPSFVQDQGYRRVAIVFGNEADGLTRQELACCQRRLHLATPGSYPSYNLAQAVAIIGYHLVGLNAAAATAPQALKGPCDIATLRRLEQHWVNSLGRFNYFRSAEPEAQRERYQREFRQLLQRWHPSKSDATVIMAALAQFNYHSFGDKGNAEA